MSGGASGRAAAAALFAGPGEVRALARTLDWGATPLGWPDTWSPALRIATRAMLDAPHPICLWAGPTYALVYNDAYRRILAAKHPAALGQPGSVVWAEIWEGLEPQFAQVSAGGAPIYGEDARFVMARLEGGGTEDAWFSYSLSPLRDEDGAIVAVLNISPETTARVRAEQALEAERARLAEVVRLAPAFMAVLRGPDHVIELTNAGYDALVGHRPIRGRPVAAALPEAAAQGFVALLDRVLATGEPFVGREVPYRRPDAAGVEDLRYVDFVYQALTEADGAEGLRRSGVFVHGVDVTDQVRARGEVERLLAESERARADAEGARREAEAARGEAEEANAAKSMFLANMSHELRTPLNAIGGYVELLDLGLYGPVTEVQRDALGRVQRAQRHLLALINDVLNYAKLEAGKVEYDVRDVDVGGVLADVMLLVEPQLAAKGLAYAGPRPDAPVRVCADPEKLRQVLLNLLSNAVKFTPAGGRVLVRAADAPGTPGVVRVEVEDTGVGIPAEKLESIFDPFVQVAQGRTRQHEGTGLGLAISRDLARGMGGDLTVESALGVGSTFTLTLPRSGAGAA